MTDPHGQDPDEDPEDHLGQEVPDPWDEPEPPVDYNTSGWT